MSSLANIKIYKPWMKKIQRFVEARCNEDQSLYKKRGAFKREDIISGAMGEVASYLFLREKGFKVNKPDFSIHSKGSKSFDCDLTDGSKKFHIKSQSRKSSVRYGRSWLMQRHDPIITKPERLHYFIFTEVNLEAGSVEILSIPTVKSLVDNGAIAECAVPSFRRTKVAIYYKDVLEKLSASSLKRGLMGSQK